ncbi:MAG: hypothetical protein FWG50_01815 [Kiritimatiellaeota bacterium]|nr:hypothetical protein [Kiritimatiellota bacterium]
MNRTPYIVLMMAALLWGCSREEEQGHVHGPACSHEEAVKPDGGGDDCDCGEDHGLPVRITREAQKLLALTSVTAEKRNVQGTARFPGRFEVRPSARRVYSAILEGVARAYVQPYQRVAEGDVLFRLMSPSWVQQSGQVREAEAALAFAQAEAKILSERLERLTAAGTKSADLEMTLKLKNAEAAKAEAALKSAAEARQAILAYYDEDAGELVFKAREAGIVERIEIGSRECPPGACTCSGAEAWIQAGTEIVSVVREDGVWFRADGLVSELAGVCDGLRGCVTPPKHGGTPCATVAEGVVSVAWSADADTRTRPLYLTLNAHPPWVKPGVPGVLEIITEESGEAAVAVPVSCVVEDGLERVVFVRDAHNDEVFIRKEVSLGVSDGEWVEVTGVETGAVIVLHGAYELKLAFAATRGANAPRAAGHFHADGQFHEGED